MAAGTSGPDGRIPLNTRGHLSTYIHGYLVVEGVRTGVVVNLANTKDAELGLVTVGMSASPMSAAFGV